MTKIYKFQDDISTDALKELEKHSSLAIDTEGSGLQIPHRDKLSLIQFSTGNNDAYIIQPNRKNYKAPNIVKILENPKITKIDTIDTETPVKGPHIPPSAIVKVPKKLFIGMPGWPNSPGIKFPKTPYKIAKKLTNGNGQPTERLAISNTINNKINAIKN